MNEPEEISMCFEDAVNAAIISPTKCHTPCSILLFLVRVFGPLRTVASLAGFFAGEDVYIAQAVLFVDVILQVLFFAIFASYRDIRDERCHTDLKQSFAKIGNVSSVIYIVLQAMLLVAYTTLLAGGYVTGRLFVSVLINDCCAAIVLMMMMLIFAIARYQQAEREANTKFRVSEEALRQKKIGLPEDYVDIVVRILADRLEKEITRLRAVVEPSLATEKINTL